MSTSTIEWNLKDVTPIDKSICLVSFRLYDGIHYDLYIDAFRFREPDCAFFNDYFFVYFNHPCPAINNRKEFISWAYMPEPYDPEEGKDEKAN